MSTTISSCGRLLLAGVVAWAFSSHCLGQTEEASVVKDKLESPPVESVSLEQVDAQIEKVEQSQDLDEATKKGLSETLAKAKASLQKTLAEQKEEAKFTAWIANAAADRAEAEARKQQPPKPYDFSSIDEKELSGLTKDLEALERQRDAAKKEFEAARDEPQRRTKRLQVISDEVTAARKTVEESEQALQALKQTDAPPIVLQSRKMQRLASRQEALAVIAAREAERRAYEAQADLPRLWIEIAAERLKQLDAAVEKLSSRIADRRQYDAGEQLSKATEKMEHAPAVLKPLWKSKVVSRALKWIELADLITDATQERDKISADLEKWQEDFKKTKMRADKAASRVIGQLLIRKKSELPSVVPLRKEFQARELKIQEVQARLYDLEDRRLELTDVNTQASATIEQLRSEHENLPKDAHDRLVELYTWEKNVLDQLHNDTNRQFNLLIASNEYEEDLIAVIQQYSEFIDQRIFWIRSTHPPTLKDLTYAGQAIAWLVNPAGWEQAAQTLLANFRRDPVRPLLGALIVSVVFFFRKRARRGIGRLATIAEPRSCRTFAPTLRALWLTTVIAAGWPAMAYYLGWAIRGAADGQVRAFSETLCGIALPLFVVEFAVQVCRSNGLAVSHFMWPAAGVATLKSNLRLLLLAGLPLVLVFSVLALQSNQRFHASLGRFCYVAFMILLAFLTCRVVRAKGQFLEGVLAANPGGWLSRLQRVWRVVIVLMPLILSVLAIIGFYYTSQRLAEYLLQTVVLVFALTVLGAMLYRWVRVKRRRLRWQQAMEYRERQAGDEEADTSKIAEITVEEEEVDLANIDQQTRRLVRSFLFFAGLIGMWLIWAKVIPMLGMLDERNLWQMKDAAGESVAITIADVLMSAIVIAITVASARNIPGLVDIMLLERLQVESSIRYAISTLSQYLIVTIGIITAATTLGFSWSKLQWLVAAMGVGLGFGLQEIVANFVCGIILLFERPIRVGDVVTLGDTTGVVTKISIRATRICNWDRQELVIPNKDLITGRIVNWTLTDKLNRFVVNVGVAYGSDTRRARELIFEILRDEPNVLDDPVPLVTFEQFGDSTLNFAIRAYLANLDKRLETIHEVHTLIHERFNDEGIEIAFPQRDLHIKSIEASLAVTGQEGTSIGMTPTRESSGEKD